MSFESQLEAEYHDESWDYRVTPSAVRTDCPIAKWLLGVRRKKQIYSWLESIHEFEQFKNQVRVREVTGTVVLQSDPRRIRTCDL